MKILPLIFFLTLPSCAATAQNKISSGLPTSINKIETHRINSGVVRVIKHNMEINPIVELEIIKTPEFTVSDYLSINSIKAPDNEYRFENSDGVFVESIDMVESNIHITFELYLPKNATISFFCKVPITKDSFGTMQCDKALTQ